MELLAPSSVFDSRELAAPSQYISNRLGDGAIGQASLSYSITVALIVFVPQTIHAISY
jgi:hypothetical protein